jgi:hypothetical protein
MNKIIYIAFLIGFLNNLNAQVLTTVGNSVGIGTTDPHSNLDVNGSFRLNRPANLVDSYNAIGGQFILTPNPYTTANNGYLKIGYPDDNTIRFGTDYDGNVGAGVWKKIQFGRYSQPYLTILDGGNVGIGTITPQYLLDVKGTIRATEVLVQDISQFPDFVFEKSYKLPKLSEVNGYIQTNGHLPNIPSATEVKENGMSLVDMQVKLLQKVEELTLYVIDLQKTNEQQSAKIEELEQKLK